jgi:hypothetical protein
MSKVVYYPVDAQLSNPTIISGLIWGVTKPLPAMLFPAFRDHLTASVLRLD